MTVDRFASRLPANPGMRSVSQDRSVDILACGLLHCVLCMYMICVHISFAVLCSFYFCWVVLIACMSAHLLAVIMYA